VPTLYRPKVVTYRMPDGSYRTPEGKRVTKDTPGAVRTESRSPTWHGRYTDGAGVRHQAPLSRSKEVARRMLAKLAGDAQLAGVGISDPFAGHRARPLLGHLEDFGRTLAARNNTPSHVEKTLRLARAVLEGCGLAVFEDVEPAAVVEFLAGLRADRARPVPDLPEEWYTALEAAPLVEMDVDYLRHLARTGPLPGPAPQRRQGRPVRLHRDTLLALHGRRGRGVGVRTSNDYLRSIKQFTRWLARERRAPFDPLAHLSRLNAAVDVRHPRRPLDAAEFARFVEATGDGRVVGRLPGPDRLVLYCLSARTGLRAAELASLTPASFDLGASPPTVTVEAAYSKHRRRDVLPLRRDVAEVVAGFLAGKPKGARLWPGRWHKDGAALVRADLAAGGIPYEDEGGRVFDFHALRHTFLTHLAESRVHPKVAQVLARHSSITLTMDRYTHLNALDVAGDLDKLPDLPLPGAKGPEPKDECKARARRRRA
jgi:integrase